MNNCTEYDETDLLKNVVKVHQRPNGNVYSAYIYEIGEPELYEDLFAILDACGEDDVVKLIINSPGGRLDTSIQLYNAIKASNATVAADVEGLACSGGSILMLACSEWKIANNARIMVHAASSGIYGKAHEIQASVEFDKKWDSIVFPDIYRGFLTDKEIGEVLAGRDIWLTGDETFIRLQKFVEYKEKEQKKLMKGKK